MDESVNFLVDFLAEQFRRAVFLCGNSDYHQDIIESEKPDIVLHFISKRLVTSYGQSVSWIQQKLD